MAQELSRYLDIPYFKNEDEHKYFHADPAYFIHAIRYVDTYFTKYLEASGASVILDRAWPSEWVYSKVFGRETDNFILDFLDKKNAELGTLIISPYRKNYDLLDDYDNIKENIVKIDQLYLELSKWTGCKMLRFCVDDLTLDQEMDIIMNFIEENS